MLASSVGRGLSCFRAPISQAGESITAGTQRDRYIGDIASGEEAPSCSDLWQEQAIQETVAILLYKYFPTLTCDQ